VRHSINTSASLAFLVSGGDCRGSGRSIYSGGGGGGGGGEQGCAVITEKIIIYSNLLAVARSAAAPQILSVAVATIP